VQAATWRLVFLINVPLAALVAVVAVRHVPESANPEAATRLDVMGAVTAAVGLAGLTYGFTAWPAAGGTSPVVLGSLAVGVAGLLLFVLTERRSSHPMLPLEVFSSTTFTAVNLVTFAVYAALGGVFFLVVLNLQVVAGYPPLAAGLALLPVTLLMLLLSARAGALGQRIGPRLPMTVGPVVCAGALVLLSGVDADASYPRDVLPAAVLLGLGLSLTVAPLTATALGALDERRAGIASAVNNAVARTAGLLAVAILPLVAGFGGGSLTDAADLAPAYRSAMLICAGLLLVGAAVAFLAIPSAVERRRAVTPPSPVRTHCAVAGTPLHPRPPAAAGLES
jgi:MFS family permease